MGNDLAIVIRSKIAFANLSASACPPPSACGRRFCCNQTLSARQRDIIHKAGRHPLRHKHRPSAMPGDALRAVDGVQGLCPSRAAPRPRRQSMDHLVCLCKVTTFSPARQKQHAVARKNLLIKRPGNLKKYKRHIPPASKPAVGGGRVSKLCLHADGIRHLTPSTPQNVPRPNVPSSH